MNSPVSNVINSVSVAVNGFNIIHVPSLTRSSKAFRRFTKLFCLAAEATGCSEPVILFEARNRHIQIHQLCLKLQVFLFLLTIDTMWSTILLQKMDIFILTLIKCHQWGFLVTTLYNKITFHESYTWFVVWSSGWHANVFLKDWHPASIVRVAKGTKP